MSVNRLPKWTYLDSRKLSEIASSDPDHPPLLRFLVFEALEWTIIALTIFLLYSFIWTFWEAVSSLIIIAGTWIGGLLEAAVRYVLLFLQGGIF